MDYKANIQKLLEILEQTPPERVYLNRYTVEVPGSTCGTLHCSAGWAASHPFFNAQGLVLYQGMPAFSDNDRVPLCEPADTIEAFFGKGMYDALFASRRSGVWDYGIAKDFVAVHERCPTDKELAILRVKKALREFRRR